MASWPSSLKKDWTDSAFIYGESQLQGLELQSEICFELMPDLEAPTMASKRALELDALDDVRLPYLSPCNATRSLLPCNCALGHFFAGRRTCR